MLITDRDRVLQGLIKLKDVHGIQDKTKRLEEVMNTNYAFVSIEDSLLDILDVMNTSDQGYLPVVDGSMLHGLITRSSLLSVLSEQFMQEEETI